MEAALSWPLVNCKLFVSTELTEEKRLKLLGEMDKFPYYHAEILNAWAYVYDIIKDYRFPIEGAKARQSVTSMMAARRLRGEM